MSEHEEAPEENQKENTEAMEPQDYSVRDAPLEQLASSNEPSAADKEMFSNVQQLLDKTERLQEQVDDQKHAVTAIQAIVVFGFFIVAVMVATLVIDAFHQKKDTPQQQFIYQAPQQNSSVKSPSPKPSYRPTSSPLPRR